MAVSILPAIVAIGTLPRAMPTRVPTVMVRRGFVATGVHPPTLTTAHGIHHGANGQ